MLWSKLTSWDNLWKAWLKVSSKGSGPGVDGISLDVFSKDTANELTALQNQLEAMYYNPLPVKKILLEAKEGKQREIGILTVRDRIVHQAIMQVLTPIFEPLFQKCSYAYRPGRSALQLVEAIENSISLGKRWVLKMDIDSFFDTMDHDLLLRELGTKISENQVLDLIEKCLKINIFTSMSLKINETGTVQGSSLSPLLSNIYLNPFDRQALAQGYCYFRYSDDILFLGVNKSEMLKARDFALHNLALIKLSCHEGKTFLLNVEEEELNFVGYSFKAGVKAVGKKAVASWQQKIEAILQDNNLLFKEKQVKLNDFWVGWRNYYPQNVEGSMPQTYVMLLRLNRALITNNIVELEAANEELLKQKNDQHHPALHAFFAECWLQQGDFFRALLELSKAFSRKTPLPPLASIIEKYFAPKGIGPEILELSSSIAENLNEENILNAIDYFAERGWFFLSQSASDFLHRYRFVVRQKKEEEAENNETRSVLERVQRRDNLSFELSSNEQELFLDLFSGREGVYGKEVIKNGNRSYQAIEAPFTIETLNSHLQGDITAGLYIRRLNDTVKVLVIDLDIGKKYLLQVEDDSVQMAELLEQAHRVALKVHEEAASWGFACYIEDSGYRGRHCWFFLNSPLKISSALVFFQKLRLKVGICERSINWEFFPGREKIKKGQHGELIKLPLGIHGITGRPGLFLRADGKPYPDQGALLRSIIKNEASWVEATAQEPENTSTKVKNSEKISVSDLDTQNNRLVSVPFDLQGVRHISDESKSGLHLEKRLRHLHPLTQKASLHVRQVINHCKLVEHLVFKALETSYLPHRERFTLLCVFGHLGEEGKRFLHEVLSFCLNYNYQITEKHVRRLPPKPVSCPRLRQEYKELTAGLGCDCSFHPQRKGCYPSPVLHALSGEQIGEKVTEPVGRGKFIEKEKTPAAEKEKLEQINAITQKLINLRKQQQGISNSISACKLQLLDFFEKKGIEKLHIDLGTLVMQKKGDEADFIIEI